MTYEELRKVHQDKIDALPLKDEALESLGLSLEDERTQRLFPIAEKRYLATVKN